MLSVSTTKTTRIYLLIRIAIEDYADLLRHFVQSPLLQGKRLIAIGHSASTTAWYVTITATCSTSITCLRTLACFQLSIANPFLAFIFFEPVQLLPPILENDSRIQKGVVNVKVVTSRKNVFDSPAAAAEWTKRKFPWKIWDEKVTSLYLVRFYLLDRDRRI